MMPKVRILQSVSGLDFSWIPGELVDLSDHDAAKWADGDRAELVDDPPPPGPTEAERLAAEQAERVAAEKEAATVQPPTEKAAQRSRSGGRSRKIETRGGATEGDTAPAESAADATNDPAPGGDTPDSGD